MKKLISFLFSLCLFGYVFAQSEAVKFSNLPKESSFLELYDNFLQNEYYSDHWDPNWNYEKPKESVINELSEFNAYVTQLGETEKNYEICLLSLIAKTYLYNLDAYSYDDIVEYAENLKKSYPDEYRTWWILGRFYMSSSVDNGYPEYETALQMRGGIEAIDDWSVSFLGDYIYACNMVKMRQHARYALRQYCNITNTKEEDFYLYKIINPPDATVELGTEIEGNKLWDFHPVADNLYLMSSTLFGAGIVVHGEWNLQLMPYSNNTSAVVIQSPYFKIDEDNTTSTSMLVLIEPGMSEKDAQNFIKSVSKKNNMKLKKQGTRKLNSYYDSDIKATVYNVENPNNYNDIRGGMKGLFVQFTIPYDEFSGYNLEFPFKYSSIKQQEDGPHYYALSTSPNRLPVEISFIVQLDACNAVFDQASDWFWNILEVSIFE